MENTENIMSSIVIPNFNCLLIKDSSRLLHAQLEKLNAIGLGQVLYSNLIKIQGCWSKCVYVVEPRRA